LKASSSRQAFKNKFLAIHNEYRKKHGAPALTLNQELCVSAQAWADHLLSTKALQHSNTDNGENLFYAWSSTPKKCTGHFTQVVWKSSQEVGVGLATDENTVFVVGQYKPPGNVSNPGYFKDNVLLAGNQINS
uniref:SCP domain-containing protein n=1 Tax=Electrophorus electricus TaxID=8005 RepID=A0AAY5ETI7_ELEEL